MLHLHSLPAWKNMRSLKICCKKIRKILHQLQKIHPGWAAMVKKTFKMLEHITADMSKIYLKLHPNKII